MANTLIPSTPIIKVEQGPKHDTVSDTEYANNLNTVSCPEPDEAPSHDTDPDTEYASYKDIGSEPEQAPIHGSDSPIIKTSAGNRNKFQVPKHDPYFDTEHANTVTVFVMENMYIYNV